MDKRYHHYESGDVQYSSKPSSKLSSFQPFPFLPKELREAVWTYACSQLKPRVIELSFMKCSSDRAHAHIKPRSRHIPPLLHVCPESRNIGLKSYQHMVLEQAHSCLEFRRSQNNQTNRPEDDPHDHYYFNPDRDVVYLPFEVTYRVFYPRTQEHKESFAVELLEWIFGKQGVQRVAISSQRDASWNLMLDLFDMPNPVVTCLAGIQEISFIMCDEEGKEAFLNPRQNITFFETVVDGYTPTQVLDKRRLLGTIQKISRLVGTVQTKISFICMDALGEYVPWQEDIFIPRAMWALVYQDAETASKIWSAMEEKCRKLEVTMLRGIPSKKHSRRWIRLEGQMYDVEDAIWSWWREIELLGRPEFHDVYHLEWELMTKIIMYWSKDIWALISFFMYVVVVASVSGGYTA